jgi:tetratricopeptide (TPR) repeat protein
MVKSIACVLAAAFTLGAARPIPYEAYTFERYNRAVPAPASYMPEMILDGETLGAGAFLQPSALFRSSDDKLYITDTGNRRIVVLNTDFQLDRVIDSFWDEEGEPFEFASPRGLFAAADGRMHVADPELRQVITLDAGQRIINRIGKPESELLGRDFNYSPAAVLEDRTGVIYILSQGCFQGALMIDWERDNVFLGFYGASEVQMTLARMAQRIWMLIFTREQRTRMAQFIPVEYTNFMIDSDSFIYTCSAFTENSVGQLRKLNALGNNVMRIHTPGGQLNYGDPVTYDGNWTRVTSAFVDITCDDDGFISALDRTRGRVFQYDEDSNLIAVFGKLGDQDGCFTNPVALESFSGRLCVLDGARGTVTVFGRTAYGNAVRQAAILYQDGRYEEALEAWRAVLSQNANYEFAYLGVGLGLAKTGRLREALGYVRVSQNRRAYDHVFEEYRKEVMKEYFDAAATLLVVLGLLLAVWLNRRRLPFWKGRRPR